LISLFRHKPCFYSTRVTIIFILGISLIANAQNPLSTIAQGADSLKLIKGEYVRKFYVLPVISASPETSLRIGAAGVFLFRRKRMSADTQLSSIRVPISYTLNNQFKGKVDINYYSNGNKHIVIGRVQWFDFPLLFYGIGNNTSDLDEEIYTTQTFSTEITYLKLIIPFVYAGIGYSYAKSDIVKFEDNGLLAEPGLIPGNKGAITSGFNINIRYDSRDNNLGTASGLYVNMKISNYEPSWGSDYDFTRLDVDIRKFFLSFSKHVLAVQLVLANTWGNPSFETMALLGGKTIMRGHYIGRYRDNSLYAAQAEYRLPLGRSDWIDSREKVPFMERWVIVGFVGFGDVATSFESIELNKIKSSVGFGLRYLVLPKERINVRIDFGFGTQNPGLYFNIREAF
jgi:outer membrane protein assembly factor BamA